MEKMPFRERRSADGRARRHGGARNVTVSARLAPGAAGADGGTVTLRELRLSDAPSLLAMLATEEVARFISPPPTTVEGFERFIAWTHRERAAATTCASPSFRTAWTRRSASSRSASSSRASHSRVGLRDRLGVLGHWDLRRRREARRRLRVRRRQGMHRLEARAAVQNGRGNGALRKIGAMQEGVLRKSFLRNGEYLDQVLWTILDDDWRRATRRKVKVH